MLFKCFSRLGTSYSSAFLLLDEMKRYGVSPSLRVYHHILRASFALTNREESLRVFELLNKAGLDPNAETFDTLIKGLIEQNAVSDAVDCFHEMLSRGLVTEIEELQGKVDDEDILSTMRQLSLQKLDEDDDDMW
eukprot:TRINITY_DN13192_c0_g1_i1.p1 TRINITY_DN13192_c0_g1~~TRINITY_DN13192_c0_g1_i1.p1  ORF type:complete len:135 (-),score=39.10 TRINITY_DN13192_c0_g1_i1:89-493(-)